MGVFKNKSIKQYLKEIERQTKEETKRYTINEIYHDEHLKEEHKNDLRKAIMKKWNMEDYEL